MYESHLLQVALIHRDVLCIQVLREGGREGRMEGERAAMEGEREGERERVGWRERTNH